MKPETQTAILVGAAAVGALFLATRARGSPSDPPPTSGDPATTSGSHSPTNHGLVIRNLGADERGRLGGETPLALTPQAAAISSSSGGRVCNYGTEVFSPGQKLPSDVASKPALVLYPDGSLTYCKKPSGGGGGWLDDLLGSGGDGIIGGISDLFGGGSGSGSDWVATASQLAALFI